MLAATLLGCLAGLATATAHGGRGLGGRRTHRGLNIRATLVALLRDLEDRLERLALLRLHRLLHVREPLVALACLLSLHFVLGMRKNCLLQLGRFLNKPTRSVNVDIPLASKRDGCIRIRHNCSEFHFGSNERNVITIVVS